MHWIFLFLTLTMCLTGCASIQADKQTPPTDAPNARQADSEQHERTRELSPEAMARAEAGIRKHLALPATTVFSDWHVSGEVEVEAVTENADQHDSQQIIRKKWRFRLGRDGMLTLSPLPAPNAALPK